MWTLLSPQGWSHSGAVRGSAGPCPPRKSTSLPASSVTEGSHKHTTSKRIHSLDSCTVPSEYVVYATCSGTLGGFSVATQGNNDTLRYSLPFDSASSVYFFVLGHPQFR